MGELPGGCGAGAGKGLRDWFRAAGRRRVRFVYCLRVMNKGVLGGGAVWVVAKRTRRDSGR